MTFLISGPIYSSDALHCGSTGQLRHGKLNNVTANDWPIQNALQRLLFVLQISSNVSSCERSVSRDFCDACPGVVPSAQLRGPQEPAAGAVPHRPCHTVSLPHTMSIIATAFVVALMLKTPIMVIYCFCESERVSRDVRLQIRRRPLTEGAERGGRRRRGVGRRRGAAADAGRRRGGGGGRHQHANFRLTSGSDFWCFCGSFYARGWRCNRGKSHQPANVLKAASCCTRPRFC